MTWLTWRSALVVTLVASAVAAVYALSRSLRGAGTAYYDVPPVAVIVVFVAALLAAAGVGLMRRGYGGRIALLSMVAAALGVFGVLSLFTIGLLLLLVDLSVLLALGRAMGNRDPRSAAIAALSGAALGVSLVTLLLAATRPPVVECLPGGAQMSSGAQHASGSAVGTGPGASSGTMTEDGVTIHYTCQDGRLVEFRRERP